jgi:hypothetical protein
MLEPGRRASVVHDDAARHAGQEGTLMAPRRKPGLKVTFERDGEEPIRIEANDGKQAMLRATALLLANQELRSGDRLTVETAD